MQLLCPKAIVSFMFKFKNYVYVFQSIILFFNPNTLKILPSLKIDLDIDFYYIFCDLMKIMINKGVFMIVFRSISLCSRFHSRIHFRHIAFAITEFFFLHYCLF